MRSITEDGSAPPLLMTSEEGSFAQGTVLQRKPQIIRQVLDDMDYPPEIRTALIAFSDEIRTKTMQPLHETTGQASLWNHMLSRLGEPSWLESPWYFAEAFFYRRLMEVVRYYQPGPWRLVDPFAPQKTRQTQADLEPFAVVWKQILSIDFSERFEVLLHSALWGNRTDLSNFTTVAAAAGGLAVSEEAHRILINHTEDVHRLLKPGVLRVDFINDNVGSELISDLALAAFLIEHGWAKQVVMHLKAQPYYVSDAMPADVQMTIDQMQAHPDKTLQALGNRLAGCQETGCLIFLSDPFWNSPYFFTELLPHIKSELERSALIIIKGDANYRRVIEDRRWPHTARVEQINRALPRPFLLLRTLKAELMAGLAPGQAEQLFAEDPGWLTNGVRGVIHLIAP
ncbi:MAG TPA: damage-control phosphatase ARMT1 family protein [Levilinea sp.]|nr:damage-control phosphatase ARMT1 family protein [Levilinea sp.]